MSEKSFWYLENVDVTNIFCPRKMDDEKKFGHTHKDFKKGDYIYLQDDHADRLFLIVNGRVKIGSYGDGNKEITKAILTTGEVFGELSIIGNDKRRDFAYVMDDTSVCVLPVSVMKEMMKDHSSLSLFFMKMMGSRVLEMEKRLESLVFKDSRTRIIEHLLQMVDKRGQRVGYEWLVRDFITHQEIANITATSRQTVTTVLNELRNRNMLTFNRKRLLIRDLDQLKSELAVIV